MSNPAPKSWQCRHCGGHGLVTVYHRRYEGHPVIADQEPDKPPRCFAAVVMAHCECKMGEWMRERTTPEICDRIPDLKAVLAGRTDWSIDDPTIPEPPDELYDQKPSVILAGLRARYERITHAKMLKAENVKDDLE